MRRIAFSRSAARERGSRDGTPAAITDAYVPAGADAFSVDSAAGFRPGDTVLIQRPVTEAWIRFMDMDKLTRDGKPQTWIKAGHDHHAPIGTIKSIAGNRITLDVPLSDSFDAAYLNPPGATRREVHVPRTDRAGRPRVAARDGAGAGQADQRRAVHAARA